MKILGAMAGAVLFILALLYCAKIGLNRSDLAECERWQSQYKELGMRQKMVFAADFQSWQAAQCEAHNIDVFAK